MLPLCLSTSAAPPPEPPPLPRFDADELLARLAGKEAALPDILLQRFGGQRGLLQFYQRFLGSSNLVAFMHVRKLAAAEWQQQEWAAAAAAAAAPMQELLTVEAFFHLEQRLAAARQHAATAGGGHHGDRHGDAAQLAEQLQQQLRLAFSELPEDLQSVIMATPSHAELLSDAELSAEQAPAGGLAPAATAAATGQKQRSIGQVWA